MRLHADGKFDMSMAGKGVRWKERGAWRREDGRVVLSIEAKPEPLFAGGATTPWDLDAETRMRVAEHEAELSAVLRRCPFMGYVADRAAPLMDAAPAPPDKALVALKDAIAALEVAAAEYVLLDDGSLRDATFSVAAVRASETMMEFRSAEEDARDAYRMAGQDISSLPQPVLPAACRWPLEPASEALPPELWRGGYGVIVDDPDFGVSGSDVMVAFLFQDGVRMEAVTDRNGWAGVRSRDVPLQSLIVTANDASGTCQSFVLAVREQGHRIFGVRMRHESLLPPLQLELSVDGDALVPQWEGIDGFQPGRYRRD